MFTDMAFWFIVSSILFWVGWYLDAEESKTYQYYGLKEAAKLWADSYGNFDYSKNLLWTGIYYVGAVVLGLFTGWGAAFAVTIPFAYRIVQSFLAKRHKKVNRLKQTQILSRYHNDPLAPEANLGMLMTRGGRSFFLLFKWLYIPASPNNEGIAAAHARIREYAQNTSPANWFPE
jgi:hypothetical protein